MSFASDTAVSARRPTLCLILSLVAGSLVVLLVGVWLMREAVLPPVAAAAQRTAPATLPTAIERALRIEKDKVESLSRELALARREIEAQAELTADRDKLAQEGAALRKALQQMSEEAVATEEALVQERARNKEWEQALRQGKAPVSPETNEATQQTELRTNEEPAASSQQAVADSGEGARLMTRARQLLEQGDIGSARAVLERASELGSVSALFVLAETYDPATLATWGTAGTQGDPVKAKAFYAKALARGVAAAKDRLAALGPQPKEAAE